MLLLFILSVLATGNADLICMYNKMTSCYIPFIERKDDEYCSAASQTIECLKKQSSECDVEDAREVIHMEVRLKEVCREGTELNKVYMKHRTCVFQLARQEASAPCLDDVASALANYTSTGYEEEDRLGRFRLYCRYDDLVNMCLEEKVSENCGEEAEKFHRKFFGPGNDLVLRACIENGAVAYHYIWTHLFQATVAVLMNVLFVKVAMY